ncbi:MAG: YihY/virulence factor BrkB family protein [Acidobacteria bacterium]|nr:YihY/virulence factor BrkB family protein [Acidobacteriota bacterium]
MSLVTGGGAPPPPASVARTMASIPLAVGLAIWRAFLRFINSDNLTYASSISYYALLSLFPLFLLLFSILGTATASESARLEVLNFVLRYFPRQFDFISTQVDAFRHQRVQLGVLATLLIMWSALGVFGALTTAVNYAWRVERQPSYFKHKLVSFLMLAASGVLMVAALALASAGSIVNAHWFAGVLAGTSTFDWLHGLWVRWASTVLFILVTGLIYYFVPNTNKVRFRDVWPGAIVAGLLWRAALTGFGWYVRDLSRFSVHGTIAGVVVFLLWVYVTAIVLLYGVEVTVAYATIRRVWRADRHTPVGQAGAGTST